MQKSTLHDKEGRGDKAKSDFALHQYSTAPYIFRLFLYFTQVTLVRYFMGVIYFPWVMYFTWVRNLFLIFFFWGGGCLNVVIVVLGTVLVTVDIVFFF